MVTKSGRRRRTAPEHLYVRRNDPKRAVTQYNRVLHICPTRPTGGVHLGVHIDLIRGEFGPNPPPGATGHQRQITAGLNLTAKQARKVIVQMQAILDESPDSPPTGDRT